MTQLGSLYQVKSFVEELVAFLSNEEMFEKINQGFEELNEALSSKIVWLKGYQEEAHSIENILEKGKEAKRQCLQECVDVLNSEIQDKRDQIQNSINRYLSKLEAFESEASELEGKKTEIVEQEKQDLLRMLIKLQNKLEGGQLS